MTATNGVTNGNADVTSAEYRREWALQNLAPVIDAAVKKGDIFENEKEITHAPVAQFYDMDLLDAHMQEAVDVFGPNFLHCVAIKGNSITRMLQHACKKFPAFGIECASIGETLHAIQHCGVPKDRVVFDSPCKTVKELEWAIREKIYINLDNPDEFARTKAYIDANEALFKTSTGEYNTGIIGYRINPLVGAGQIAALSVSTQDSKFGTPVTEERRAEMLGHYKENPWMNSVHVHVGSGGMGVKVLAAGIRVAVDFAKEINKQAGFKQVKYIDMGGGAPVNYYGDKWGNAEKNVPTYAEYAAHLKENIPELFDDTFERITTEFGQSMWAKSGFLCSQVEFMKGTPENPIAIIHFGGSECVRQVYGGVPHARRLEGYKNTGEQGVQRFTKEDDENVDECYGALTQGTGKFAVGGPLCFQGDFVAKEVKLPSNIKAGDFIAMKDAGSNTLSIFSRHCSRMCPAVWGYRWNADGTAVAEWIELKPRELPQDVSNFWGPTF